MESLAAVGLSTVQRFKRLEEVTQPESADNQLQEWPKNMFLAQFDRFELWAVNLGLFVMGHGSLDYRIRDSESMKESMYMMIQNLNRSLDEVLDYVNGNIGQEDDDSDIDSESESDIDLLLGSIKDPIDRLYKLAVWIRNPATRLTSSKARNFKQIDPESNVDLFESYENHDYDYVSSLFLEYEKHKALQEAPAVECKDKNPVGGDRDADDKDHVWEPIRGVLKLHKERILHCSESYLVRRIARANGRRRQQFAYWKRHQDKLREHASMFVEAPARQLSDAEHIINGLIGETKTVLSVTTATQLRIPQLAGQEILEKEGVLKLDVSEYAPSAWNPSKDTVSFPLPPKVSTSDNFFECPYCYTICPISLLSEKAWRAHIIRDLRPYICTYEQCSNAEQLYDTRDEWMQHEISTHQRIFRCSKHEEEIFTTLEAYKEHVQNYHKGEAEFSKFATSTVKNVHRSCPVCSIILGSIEKLQSHIALHLERFAMFSLPRHIDNDDQSEAGSHSNHAKLDSISFNEDPDVESTWTDGIGDAQSGNLTNLEQDIILPVSAEDNSSDEGKGTQQCEVPGCGKTFKSFKQLKLHILLYHDELPRGDFICGFCTAERTFAHIDDLKRHMIDVHRLKQTPPTRRKGTNVALLTLADYPPGATGKCGTCPKTFPNAQVFYDHLDGCLMSFKDEDGGGRMKYAEERGEEKARHLAHKQKRREEEESRRLEYEAERRRLSARFEKPLRQVAARGSRRRSAVYEDGVVYRLDDALERTQDGTHLREEPPTPHIAADYNNDKESGNRDGPSTRATAQGVAFSSPKSPQQHDSSQMQENIGLSSELNAKNAYKPMPMYDLDITDSSPADPENMERRGSPNMDDALNYLDKVKDHFQDKPEVYEQFIEIFQNIKEQQAPLQDAYAEMATLFNSAPDLLEDFKQFLPDSKDQTPRGQTQNEHRAKGSINADQFMKNLMGFMREKGLPLDPNPMIRDKPISLVILFQAVQAKGGFKTLTAGNGWSSMAQTLGLQTQNPNVVVALRQIYEQNLLRFEEAWVALQEVDLETILGTPQKQVPPGQARSSLGRLEDGIATGSDHTHQSQISGHMGSPTELTQDGTHLQEYAEAQEEKDQIEAEMQRFNIAFRALRHDVNKQEVLEIEEAQGITEAQDLARKMEILKSKVEELEGQYTKEAPRAQKIEIAQELTKKMRSLSPKYLLESIEEIQTNRKKRQELIVEGKEADSTEAKAVAAKKKTGEVEELDTKTLADHTAPVEAVNMKINESAKRGETEPAPIKFKDAVGRKFSFPFHLCNTWQAMEELIKQAFLHVDVLGPRVQEGHYDIIGPNGEIILPSIWEKVIEPDWAVTMTMWPLDKPFKDPGRIGMSQKPEDPPPYPSPGSRRLSPKEPGVRIPPPPPGWNSGAPPPPRGPPRVSPNINIVDAASPKRKNDTNSSKKKASMLNFLTGMPPTKKKPAPMNRRNNPPPTKELENMNGQKQDMHSEVEGEVIAEMSKKQLEKAAEGEEEARIQLEKLVQDNANFWPNMAVEKAEKKAEEEGNEEEEAAREDVLRPREEGDGHGHSGYS